MTFEEILKHIKVGQRVHREGWNGKGQCVQIQVPDANSKMSAPYMYLTSTLGVKVPWLPSQGDIFATDWYIL